MLGISLTPLAWELSANYDPYIYAYTIMLGPLTLYFGWPFYWQERDIDDMNVVTLFGKREYPQEVYDGDDSDFE